MTYTVRPTSCTGQSILESVERVREGSNFPAISLQMNTTAANEIAQCVNGFPILKTHIKLMEKTIKELRSDIQDRRRFGTTKWL